MRGEEENVKQVGRTMLRLAEEVVVNRRSKDADNLSKVLQRMRTGSQ